jgi:methyltransferase-like protein/2-polyprenyl-3-methyl-5-hydroxy-6-metoxy-1,4-benzoquinol methylase
MAATLKSYDDVPYSGRSHFDSHPSSLAVAGHIRSLDVPPPTRCRVLELGCASGSNLIPMAYSLPESRFIGIDLSQRQIADAQKLVQRLELPNVELRAVSIADVDKSWGTFDYIICHGVYSWVPPPIQEHILWICQHLLSPRGLAYVSYNTYPGWHLKTIARDLMKYHAARFDDPAMKIQQAKLILRFIARVSASKKNPLARYMSQQADSLAEESDDYLYHEYLEESNQPVYFHEFVARLRAHGLEYLGEAWHHSHLDDLPPDVQETIQAISEDPIDLEQFLDFINNRPFRRTIFCRGDAEFSRRPDPARIHSLSVSTLAGPQSTSPEITSDKPETFNLGDDLTFTTNSPFLKAALFILADVWPSTMAFEELLAAINDKLPLTGKDADASRQKLASLLLGGYLSELIALHWEPFRFTREVGPRPRSSRVARVISVEQPVVPTLSFRQVTLSPVQRLILRLTDGTRTIEQITQQAVDADGEMVKQELASSALKDAGELTARSLEFFARNALLED